ncbi:pilus assembly protein TadG-related protein [Falsiroseomonas oryziterrae]|uniref:pilus assembly protein TadG-related protein n=1 Tax=Falsiroseomonas oryziterrae TaxID=2911368 RepID=UPI001F1D36B1|nr:pilus assembly protein TadG-related protein [Roseomonas sp. NPKOSM-4]
MHRVTPLTHDRRGAVAILSAALGAVLIGFAGLAVDTTRAWVAEARMKSALDAAALMAARRFDEADRDTLAEQLFYANLQQGRTSGNFLGATIARPRFTEISRVDAEIRVDSQVNTPTTLFSVIRQTQIIRDDFATAQRAGTGLEIAIALDATGSMASQGFGGRTKFENAVDATRDLIRILYGSQNEQRNLFISIVPYDRTINVGAASDEWLANGALANSSVNNAWIGCVEGRASRSGGRWVVTDASPANEPFRPWVWPSTFRQVGQWIPLNPGNSANAAAPAPGSSCMRQNSYPADPNDPANPGPNRFCHGDNDWVRVDPGNTLVLPANVADNAAYNTYFRNNANSATGAFGPNFMCPRFPIQPLTSDRRDVEDYLLTIRPERGGTGMGTSVFAGLKGAWYTLSPNFEQAWRDRNVPFRPGSTNNRALPRPYREDDNRKVIVILTDGDNNWFFPQPQNSRSSCGEGINAGNRNSSSTTARGVCAATGGAAELNYNALGRVADWNSRFPDARIDTVNRTTAEARFDELTRATCDAIKNDMLGVTGPRPNPPFPPAIDIYVVGFEIQTQAHRELLQYCASDPTKFIEARTAQDLSGAFTRIANELVRLRLTQ